MKHKHKKVLWVIIPLLLLGIVGVGLFSQHVPLVRAAAEPQPCNLDSNNQVTISGTTVSGAKISLSAWRCLVDPNLQNSGSCLNERDAPHVSNFEIARCFPFSDQKKGPAIVCQMDQGDDIAGSKIWDEIVTTYTNTTGNNQNNQWMFAFVSDHYMTTSGHNIGTFSPPIPNCNTLHPVGA